ncbi:MAG: hypothetical protein RLZZ158_38 [Cyanobacteriota bacterium]
MASFLPLLLAVALVQSPDQGLELMLETECRVGLRDWRACVVEVQEPGIRWQVLVGNQRWTFRNDGSGSVKMRKNQGPWQRAEPRWDGPPPQALCWGQLCARGPLPLD